MQEQDIDIALWDYIDGSCSNDEKTRIAELISNDTAWTSKYNELLALHQQLPSDLALKEVSPQFTANTMNKIAPASSNQLKPVFTWGIRAVAAFFIIAVGGLTIYSISKIDWNTDSSLFPNFSLNFNISTSYLMFGVLIFALLCAEQLFRKRFA